MQENPCRGCGQCGHWSKDPECPKNAKSSSASLVTAPAQSSVPSPEQQAEHAAMSAVLEQMMRGQQQATPRAYMAAMTSWEGSTSFSSGDFVTLVNTSKNGSGFGVFADRGRGEVGGSGDRSMSCTRSVCGDSQNIGLFQVWRWGEATISLQSVFGSRVGSTCWIVGDQRR